MTGQSTEPPGRIRPGIITDGILLCGITTIYVLLALFHARASSATFDEVSHLPSGFTYHVLDDRRLNPEHPPFLKSLAAWPLAAEDVWPLARHHDPSSGVIDDSVAFAQIGRAWAEGRSDISAQWRFGRLQLFGVTDATYRRAGVPLGAALPTDRVLTDDAFLNDAPRLLRTARLPSIALGVLLLALIFAWAHALAGRPGALFATTLAALDPNLIAHGSLVTTDMGVTTFLFGAIFAAWHVMRRPTPVAIAGLVAGVVLAASSKFSAILIIPILGSVGALWIVASPGAAAIPTRGRGHRVRVVLMIAALSTIATYGATWAAYGFRFHAVATTEERLPDPQALEDFRRLLITERAFQQADTVDLGWKNRALLSAYQHRLLPESMIRGVAFARMMAVKRTSYFMGETSTTGSVWFFPASLLTKTPDATLVAIILAVIVMLWRRPIPWLDFACLALPPVWIIGSAMGSSLNLGYRHILPALPFLVTLTALLCAPWRARPRRTRSTLALIALPIIILSTQSVRSEGTLRPIAPHFLAYVNWISGGPDQGHRRFVDSNLDWGQALPALRDWLTSHGEVRPVQLCYFGTADPRAYGIAYHSLPGCGGLDAAPPTSWIPAIPGRPVTVHGLEVGQVVAVSATSLVGLYRSPEQRAALQEFLARRTTPVGTAGFAIHLFRVTDATP